MAFFNLVFLNNSFFIIVSILILALALTLSTIDTLINAISSLIIIEGKEINKFLSGREVKSKTNKLILLLSILVFILASKGYSILYLFLFADLLCCAAVVTIFYGFFNKKINTKLSFISLPVKSLFISFPSIIIRLEIALINVSIVLNVKARAKIKIEIIIKKLLFKNTKLKKAKSGITLESNEKDIRPV